MTKLMLCLSLLVAIPYASAHIAQETMSQDAYMVQLYQGIVDFCETHENPRSLLVTIPLELIVVSGELPQELQERIISATQSMDANGSPSFDESTTLNLVAQLIPYMELIDSRIAASIKQLQKLGVRIIAISPFMPEHADAMLARMKKLGLDLKATALYAKDMPIEDQDGNRVALSKGGVVFMSDYFQSMEVLQTMVNNAPADIEQLIFAAPMPEAKTAQQA